MNSKKKIKVLCLGDHPFSPSGVGNQLNYILTGLLKTGKFQIISLAGAIKHQNYQPQRTDEFGNDWIIFPVDGYGNPEIIRSALRSHRPDILLFMTDPRFYVWLWEIANEVRPLVPMVYYHVWDNYPYPVFNKPLYISNDTIVTISKLTSDIVRTVAPEVTEVYIPHAVDPKIFKTLPSDAVTNFRNANFSKMLNKTVFFWNSRNARRKQSGTLIWWFKKFLDQAGHDNACLIMHTDPKDEHGQDLNYLISHLGMVGKILISNQKLPREGMAMMYNAVDCTLSLSDAEGFGLSTFESLACGTPIIATMTGGLQEQITRSPEVTEQFMLDRNTKEDVVLYEHGIGMEPASKAVIGSQQVPFIYEDRVGETTFLKALHRFMELSSAERKALGKRGQEHIETNYNFAKFQESWVRTMMNIHKTYGSWETRNNYQAWTSQEIK